MLHNDLDYVNVGNRIDKCTTQEFKEQQLKKKNQLDYFSYRWSVFLKFSTLVAEGHLEGTMYQICYFGHSFYLMKSKKLFDKE